MRPGWMLGLVVFVSGCGDDSAEPRPQIVMVVDTDLPVVGQLGAEPTLSPDAAVDTLRIDVIGVGGTLPDHLLVTAPEATDWPVSFGVTGPVGEIVRLRARVFRGALASAESVQGAVTLAPSSRLSVDRVLEVTIPASGVDRLGVLLSGDCYGWSPTFGEPPETCVDADRLAATPDVGVDAVAGAEPSKVGGWPSARELACKSSSTDFVRCIAGGFSILGSDSISGLAGFIAQPFDPSPARPVVVSPFRMDTTEVTVGRLRALLEAGASVPLPHERDESLPERVECTWLGASDAANDSLPVNCASASTAREICKALGGDLPTEAQWEHAARGRGQGRLYPWGGSHPECCSASIGQGSQATIACPIVGVEPVGSHRPSDFCPVADESRDGVLDLAGSLAERVLDDAASYADSCWSTAGVLNDPMCDGEVADLGSTRGATWASLLGNAAAPLRGAAPRVEQSTRLGFRCVYPEPLK